jgi:hypothetical protein
VTGNRTVFYVMGVLAVVLAIVGTVADSSKKPPPTSFLQGGSFRAVVVPTDRPRTVIVTPCDAPAPTTGEGALTTPGVTTVRIVANASGRRTVLVPRCAAQTGTATNGTANLPSAAFVLKPGEQPTVQPKPAPTGVQSQVLVPSDSPASTIVVPPCRAGAKPAGDTARQVVVQPGAGGTAVAPAC